ncbi:MAG: hypothetical protein PVH51_07380 [Thiohalophilus sp.]|jgi:hypothetical protein
MTRWFCLILILPLVNACQAPPFSPDSPLSPVPVNSTLVLQESLSIPAGKVSLWFQDGRQRLSRDVDRYEPNCKFETLKMQDSEKTVNPDSFRIYKVVRWDDYAMQPIKLAASGTSMRVLMADGGSVTHLNVTTEMFLRSENQPDVYRLVCSQWEDAADAEHVTINQMRRALGNTFSLKIPAESDTTTRK